MPSTYLTVAIPYVNAEPHLGYAYEVVAADIRARAARRAGREVRFLGGTDDNSLKNVLAAEAAGIPVGAFVDAHALRFEALGHDLAISFDDFIRTSTDPRHRPAVERLWRAAEQRGDLYRGRFEGHYCVGCEEFYTGSDLDQGDRCREHNTERERVVEDNWFFRLSRHEAEIERLIADDVLQVRPEPFRREVLAFVRTGLRDISVSRPVQRARGWGIPVPGDASQVVYVWFDALTNYLSALGFGAAGADWERWWAASDERIHLVGKGIVRFHAVYWPAFLLSAGLPLPTRIQVHPYLTANGAKLSKSEGSAITPKAVADVVGVDGLRWWFAREVSEVSDTDVDLGRVVDRVNADLAHTLGNAVNRIVSLVHRHRGGVLARPAPQRSPGATAALGSPLVGSVLEALRAFELRRAATIIVAAAADLNRRLEAAAPWEWASDHARAGELDLLLLEVVDHARDIADAIEPITPVLAHRMRQQLGSGSPVLPAPEPVFPRCELDELSDR